MSTENVFSVSCSEMGPHEASLQYNGVMCQAGALALESHFKRLFGYFKYRRVVLSIESPGGAIDGLDYVLRVIQNWAKEGRAVAVRSTFQCASAAAFLLAMGEWGHRRVDRNTFLLFHSARIDSSSMAAMTAAYSTNLSQALNNVDRRLLSAMVDKMLIEAGGASALADLVLSRVRYVNKHWKRLAANLTTFTSAADDSRKPDWLKTVQNWKAPGADTKKFVLELKKHLNLRLQRDVRMDLCEAYVLCLIDQVAGVLDADSAEAARSTPMFAQELVSDYKLIDDRPLESHGNQPSQQSA